MAEQAQAGYGFAAPAAQRSAMKGDGTDEWITPSMQAVRRDTQTGKESGVIQEGGNILRAVPQVQAENQRPRDNGGRMAGMGRGQRTCKMTWPNHGAEGTVARGGQPPLTPPVGARRKEGRRNNVTS
jgi:hypothetical protein